MLPTIIYGYPKKSAEFSIQVPTQFSKRPRNLYMVEIVKYTNCKKTPNNLNPMLNHVHVCSTRSSSLQNLEFDEYKTIWNKYIGQTM